MPKRSPPSSPAATTKGGRPRGFDRDAALDTALALFWQHGYDGVTVSELTAAIGIAAPSLYAAFGSKEALYRAALERYQQAGGAARTLLPQAGTARDAVAAALRHAVRAVSRPDRPRGCLVSSGLLACAPATEPLAQEHRRLRAAMRAEFEERIARGVRAGELPGGTSAAALARFYVTVLQGLSVQARDGAAAGELDQVVQHALAAWPR